MFNGQRIYPQASAGVPTPAPTGGLNDFDPISAMGDEFMLDCMNVYPDNSDIVVRPGYAPLQEAIGEPVINILAYVSKTGIYQMFASTATGIWAIDDYNAPVKVVALTDGTVDGVTFSNVDNAYLIVWNGVDPAHLYDGTTWKEMIQVATPSAPGEVSGLDPSKIAYIHVYKARLWYVMKNSMEMYYGPLDQAGGVLEPMPIGGNFNKGGKLVAIGSWSTNTGSGLSARLLAVTSEGEVASFSGSDPSDALQWGIDSVFYVSPPLGPYSFAAVGGDFAIMTRRGLIPISSMMSGVPSEVMFANAMTKRISNAIKRLTQNWKTLPYPVQVFNHLEVVWLTINVFDEELDRPVQYVMNVITGAWGRFDYPARVIKTFNGITYIGTNDGKVHVVTPGSYMDIQSSDADGAPITLKATCAYNYMNSPTVNKHAKFVRPVLRSKIRPSLNMRVLADFRMGDYDPDLLAPASISDPMWDAAIWDQARWTADSDIHLPWISANELGYAFAWQIKAIVNVEFRMMAAQWIYEGGGLI